MPAAEPGGAKYATGIKNCVPEAKIEVFFELH
jgi:hypothetical protein